MNDTPTPTTAVRRSTSSEDVSDDPHLNTLIAIRDRLAGIEADLAHAQGTRDANGALIVDRLGRLEGGVVAIGWDLSRLADAESSEARIRAATATAETEARKKEAERLAAERKAEADRLNDERNWTRHQFTKCFDWALKNPGAAVTLAGGIATACASFGATLATLYSHFFGGG